MPKPTVLFDLDGTLVDTNYLHAVSWRRALLEQGHDVPTAWVHRRIGMGSELLLHELIGEVDEAVKDGWRRHFDAVKGEVRAFPGAVDLLRTIVDRGAQVAFATSAPQQDLDTIMEVLGVADLVTATTNADEVEEAKPDPEVFQTCLRKADGDPERSVVVGDTPWDVESAGKAGLPCVAVLVGGFGRDELEARGAAAVLDDPVAVAKALDEAPFDRLWR